MEDIEKTIISKSMCKSKIKPRIITERDRLHEKDLIRNIKNGKCFIIEKVNGSLLDLIDIFNDQKSSKNIADITNGDYEIVAINKAILKILTILTIRQPFSTVLSPQYALNKIVDDYALQICLNVISQKSGKSIVDYPDVVVAVNEKPTNKVAVDCNSKWFLTSWDNRFLELVKNKNYTLGGIGTKSGNTIGNCAEQHAVNDLVKLYPNVDIKNIIFSKAIRPRTGEIRNYCDNCCDLFQI